MRPDARFLSALLALALLLTVGGTAFAQFGVPESDPVLLPLVTDLPTITGITNAGDERLFLSTRPGRVLIVRDGQLEAEPFLDLTDRVSQGNEQGFFTIAFHPDYATNGTFFVTYNEMSENLVISRFQVSSDDPDKANPASEVQLLNLEQPFNNHNGGQLQFGPDGYLYAAPGDSGQSFDPACLAQNKASLLGKMIRLDVDQNVDTPPYYAVPADNPFVGNGDYAPEIWALGLRNPWRFSFDRATGDLYIGDVGQNEREEVDYEPAGSAGGRNYGWKMLEGTLCQNRMAGCTEPLEPCNSPVYTPPILEYTHDVGCSVTGGYVYRGTDLPGLAGAYIYGDLCKGTIWAARREDDVWTSEELPVTAGFLLTFGEDVDGELYLAAGSTLYRLGTEEPACVPSDTVLCLEEGRFRVETTYRGRQGQEGAGTAVGLTPDSGYFWFFNADNPEVFVKVRNACVPEFNHYWVFSSGLTDVQVTLTVTDTAGGEVQVYENPQGRPYPPILDTDAFATCP